MELMMNRMNSVMLFLTVLASVLLACSNSARAATTETTTYYHTDVLGSVIAATDESGDLLWHKTYDAHGNEVLTNSSGDEVEEQGYTGKPYDKETGLLYLGQRYYDPKLRRFISIDPVPFNLGNLESFNPYIYANNNPYKFVDPDGREGVSIREKALIRDFTSGRITRQEYLDTLVEGNLFALSAVGGAAVAIGARSAYLAHAYRANQAALITGNLLSPVSVGASSVAGLVAKGVDDVVRALPAPNMVKHHIFNVFRGASPKSQKYRDFFKQHGIALDSHTIKLTVNEHKLVHQAGNNWTTQWKRWIDANPNATTKDVYQQAGRMMDAHGVGHKPIVPYK